MVYGLFRGLRYGFPGLFSGGCHCGAGSGGSFGGGRYIAVAVTLEVDGSLLALMMVVMCCDYCRG